MSVRFEGPGGSFQWRIYQLGALFDLARAHGWSEPGTLPPVGRSVGDRWDGSYTTGYGQQVTPSDAMDLAAALESALPDIPDTNAIPIEYVVISTPGSDTSTRYMRQIGNLPITEDTEFEEIEPPPQQEGLDDFIERSLDEGESFIGIPVRWVGAQVWVLDPQHRLSSYQVFSGENKAELVKFIAFCRQGGFLVR